MIEKIASEDIFFRDYGWHSGHFNFEFGDYQDPQNRDFGLLVAFNDFSVQPRSGFETHPHAEVEIISYCVDGVLDHVDNMGNKNTLFPSDCQYTCAGAGITHSEMNNQSDHMLRFLQIWFKPHRVKLQPHYTMIHSLPGEEENRLRQIVSAGEMSGTFQIGQDVNMFAGRVEEGSELVFHNRTGRQSYVYCIEGNAELCDLTMRRCDALKIFGQMEVCIETPDQAHVLIVEMKES